MLLALRRLLAGAGSSFGVLSRQWVAWVLEPLLCWTHVLQSTRSCVLSLILKTPREFGVCFQLLRGDVLYLTV